MVIIGSTVEIEGKGAGLLVTLADRLGGKLGRPGRYAFLLGALGPVFSSLLGVWQAVPYLFADMCRVLAWRPAREKREAFPAVSTRSLPYCAYLFGIATVPMPGLLMSFKEVQKLYGVIGAMFIPMLAFTLLVPNGRRAWVGNHTNRWPTVIALLSALAFFGYLAVLKRG